MTEQKAANEGMGPDSGRKSALDHQAAKDPKVSLSSVRAENPLG